MSYPQGEVSRAVYLSAIDSGTQSFGMINTPQAIDFDTLLENQNVISLGNGEFQVKDTGAYLITCSVQITKSLNPSMNYLIWLQKDTGAGFIDTSFSSSENILAGTGLVAMQSKSVACAFELKLNFNDKIRLLNAVSDTDMKLTAILPAVGPTIPSARVQITKTGRL